MSKYFSPLLIFVFLLQSCKKEVETKMFSLLESNDTGIKFKNLIEESEEFNVLEYGYLYNGGGVAIGDLNNDGLPDIYFTGNMVGSRLYINKGDFEFDEIAKNAGVFASGLWNTGTTMADVNADGYLDIYVCRSAAKSADRRKNLLFINNGDLTFTEKAAEYGIDDSGYSTQGSFFDYDKDGDLDLYVLNHSIQDYAGFGKVTPKLKNKKNISFSDKLYKNENGRFVDVSTDAGLISNVLGFGLGIAISDVNNDNWLDIYVSNDYNEQDYLYINNQDGTFSESLEKYIEHVSLFSMGSDIADINNDGYTDIMTLDMLPEGNNRQKTVSGSDNYNKHSLLEKYGFYNQSMRNMLQLNNQGQHFSEIGQFSGVSNTDWSWTALFADLDNDSYKDLFITNGYKRDYTNMDFINYLVQEKLNENVGGERIVVSELLKDAPSTVIENYAYQNNGDLTFSKMNSDWGLDQKSLSNAAAYADLDNDGDLDLVVNNIDKEAFVYKNNASAINDNHYLKIKFKGEKQNTFGIGARVEININNQVLIQEMIPARGYQSSVDHNLLFGLGNQDTIQRLKVIWPDSKVQILKDLHVNRTIVLKQNEAKHVLDSVQEEIRSYFHEKTSDSLFQFVHKENDFVDFNREHLLPHKLSTQGPKIAKGDVNKDGLEDIFIGGAKGSVGELFLQTKSGTFKATHQNTFDEHILSEDVGALFLDVDNDNDLDLYIVSGGNDYEYDAPELQDRLYLNDGKGNFYNALKSIPKMLTSGSCVNSGDMDNDGDLDLFIGGRVIPGKYPTIPRSYILENDGKGNFTDVTTTINTSLEYPGMVTDAIWSDFNGDNKPDLIIVGEWMGIRIFTNDDGKLIEISETCGTENTEGWWNKIESADFDNDGDMDYVLGNLGTNSQLKASLSEPVTMYAKDFDVNGSIDPIMCAYVMGESYPVNPKDDIVKQLNFLKSKYPNYSDYANKKIQDILTEEQLNGAQVLKVNNFNSSYLENLGNNEFKLSVLPNVVQFSPIYGILTHDFNHDGNQDLIMGGNFFGSRVKYGRYDANKGTYLLGDGKGNFNPVKNIESGLNVSGEVRDIIKIKLADERELILFAKNNANVQTYTINK